MKGSGVEGLICTKAVNSITIYNIYIKKMKKSWESMRWRMLSKYLAYRLWEEKKPHDWAISVQKQKFARYTSLTNYYFVAINWELTNDCLFRQLNAELKTHQQKLQFVHWTSCYHCFFYIFYCRRFVSRNSQRHTFPLTCVYNVYLKYEKNYKRNE